MNKRASLTCVVYFLFVNYSTIKDDLKATKIGTEGTCSVRAVFLSGKFDFHSKVGPRPREQYTREKEKENALNRRGEYTRMDFNMIGRKFSLEIVIIIGVNTVVVLEITVFTSVNKMTL